jgi:hypothetical protein
MMRVDRSDHVFIGLQHVHRGVRTGEIATFFASMT